VRYIHIIQYEFVVFYTVFTDILFSFGLVVLEMGMMEALRVISVMMGRKESMEEVVRKISNCFQMLLKLIRSVHSIGEFKLT
jgi:hypothetical protein